jgi:hypothetical protein
MKLKTPDLPTFLNLLSALILLVGLISATVIYQRAGNEPYGALGYENEGGALYPVLPEYSKQYLRGMELYGGKANVLADKLRLWLGGLFHGKSLAVIIGAASIIISFGLFYAANHLPSSKSEVRRENNAGGIE